MMPTLRFEGYSDDTFGEYASTNRDYDNGANGKPIMWLVTAGEDRMVVVGQYASGPFCGGWLIGVAAYNDRDPSAPFPDPQIPRWPMRIEPSFRTPYSPVLFVEVPEGFELEHLEDR